MNTISLTKEKSKLLTRNLHTRSDISDIPIRDDSCEEAVKKAAEKIPVKGYRMDLVLGSRK